MEKILEKDPTNIIAHWYKCMYFTGGKHKYSDLEYLGEKQTLFFPRSIQSLSNLDNTEFKERAVSMVISSEKSISQIAKDLGIKMTTLYS